jgi:tRNA (adenine37-N6)-methyltransferase
MNNPQAAMCLKPIGYVRNSVKAAKGLTWDQVVSELVILPELTEALDDLEEFSHIIVFFWMTGYGSTEVPHKVHPRGNPDFPLKGLFATRSPQRPNPVGVTTVELLERRKNILRVKGLDAFDQTPVIDIKPYSPGLDTAREAKSPEWIKEVQKRPYC